MSMIIAAMPAHNEEGTIAKIILKAKKNVDSVHRNVNLTPRF